MTISHECAACRNQKAIACLRNIAIAFITQSKVLKLCHKQQQL
ncbi:hypothetical protein [Nostoc sp.]